MGFFMTIGIFAVAALGLLVWFFLQRDRAPQDKRPPRGDEAKGNSYQEPVEDDPRTRPVEPSHPRSEG